MAPIKVVTQRRSKRSGFKPETSAAAGEACILGRGGEGKAQDIINLT
jgi:hypothetical protein